MKRSTLSLSFWLFVVILLTPVIWLNAQIIESTYFPIITIKADNVYAFSEGDDIRIRFSLGGTLHRNCKLLQVKSYWKIGHLLEPAFVYGDNSIIFTFPRDEGNANFETKPLNALLDTSFPLEQGPTLNFHYVYECH